MADKVVDVSLGTLAGGAAVERFDRELARVLKNILDPNTEPKATRKVKLEVVIKPTEDRERADISVRVSSTEAPPRPLPATFYVGQRDGQPVAVEFDPRQGDFFRESSPDVVPITRTQEG